MYKTNDLSVAAFLLMKKQKIITARKDKNNGRYIFEFEDTDGLCAGLSIEFLSSECCVYDGFIRTLRGMLSS